MDVELLYFADCPSWRHAADLLDELAAELAFTWSAVVVDTPEAAQAVGFQGSPSVRIDGGDPFAGPDAPVGGLSCRIYRTPTGAADCPDRSQLRAALIAAAALSDRRAGIPTLGPEVRRKDSPTNPSKPSAHADSALAPVATRGEMADTAYIGLGQFPTEEPALAHIEWPTETRSSR